MVFNLRGYCYVLFLPISLSHLSLDILVSFLFLLLQSAYLPPYRYLLPHPRLYLTINLPVSTPVFRLQYLTLHLSRLFPHPRQYQFTSLVHLPLYTQIYPSRPMFYSCSIYS